MNKGSIEEMIKMLEVTKAEIIAAYPEHVASLTETGAPPEVFEMLDEEHVRLNNKIDQALKNAWFMLATA